eukprot:gnl/TRDRNA2_/TRDRNA2_125794_c0_seq1.p1 gnl/TRDRNA2_/TRDRNA2_125794_c0~~gnl/TRDRNA2_/TRDRNA2_125794_c0_seq1.p1  ORF type:complete len:358 (+),score=46.79 gnl/TRDRNA2_/TRDRNA2_125794_c0_seq1:40-1074(+)
MVRELVIHGYKVRACLRNASSERGRDGVEYLKMLPNVEIYDGCDLFKPGSYDTAFKGCSAVFAVAAVLGNSARNQPTGSGDVAKDTYDGGVVGMQTIIDSVEKSGTVKRLIYTSSIAAVFHPGVPTGHEWTETDWASDGVDPKIWSHPAMAYSRSKVDAELLINRAAEASSGKWDAVTMNPAMIIGPILFKSQHGQWVEQTAQIAAGLVPNWPSKYDMYYNIIDVRDLVTAHRLAAESTVDHRATHGGSRYLMQGCGGRNALRLGTEVKHIIGKFFPSFVLGTPITTSKSGKAITVQNNVIHDCKKAKAVLGVTLRPVEETIRDCVETAVALGLIQPQLRASRL